MIKIQSPTRVDLAGGTLDLWPLYNFVGSAVTVNLAIDIWTRCELAPLKNQTIILESLDYKKKWSFENIQTFLSCENSDVALYQAVIKPFFLNRSSNAGPSAFEQGFHLITQSESPIGGGLGGSSSLVISMMKALSAWTGVEFKNPHSMVHWAHNIEAEVLTTPTGTQDYYPAVTGGGSFIHYTTAGIEQTLFDPVGTPLQDHFLLINTGRSHHSGLNNFEVLKACVEKDSRVLSALHEIKVISEGMVKVIQEKNWSMMAELFRREYAARLQLTPAFSSPEIEKLADISMKNGAEAIKICGAGGGGCVLVWVSPRQRQTVIDACAKEKFQCLEKVKPVSPLRKDATI